MALRRNTKIVGEVRIHRLLRGKITYVEADLCRGGKLFAYARKSEIEVAAPKLAEVVAIGRIHEALRQHKAGNKVRVRFAGYVPSRVTSHKKEKTNG